MLFYKYLLKPLGYQYDRENIQTFNVKRLEFIYCMTGLGIQEVRCVRNREFHFNCENVIVIKTAINPFTKVKIPFSRWVYKGSSTRNKVTVMPEWCTVSICNLFSCSDCSEVIVNNAAKLTQTCLLLLMPSILNRSPTNYCPCLTNRLWPLTERTRSITLWGICCCRLFIFIQACFPSHPTREFTSAV